MLRVATHQEEPMPFTGSIDLDELEIQFFDGASR